MRITIKPLIQKALFLLLISLAGVSYAQIPQIEREALVALYNSTDGANWTDNTGWLGEAGTGGVVVASSNLAVPTKFSLVFLRISSKVNTSLARTIKLGCA